MSDLTIKKLPFEYRDFQSESIGNVQEEDKASKQELGRSLITDPPQDYQDFLEYIANFFPARIRFLQMVSPEKINLLDESQNTFKEPNASFFSPYQDQVKGLRIKDHALGLTNDSFNLELQLNAPQAAPFDQSKESLYLQTFFNYDNRVFGSISTNLPYANPFSNPLTNKFSFFYSGALASINQNLMGGIEVSKYCFSYAGDIKERTNVSPTVKGTLDLEQLGLDRYNFIKLYGTVNWPYPEFLRSKEYYNLDGSSGYKTTFDASRGKVSGGVSADFHIQIDDQNLLFTVYGNAYYTNNFSYYNNYNKNEYSFSQIGYNLGFSLKSLSF